MYWDSKVVLITGGSAGFGKVLATEFARLGAEVVITARGESQLNQAAAEIGGRILESRPISHAIAMFRR